MYMYIYIHILYTYIHPHAHDIIVIHLLWMEKILQPLVPAGTYEANWWICRWPRFHEPKQPRCSWVGRGRIHDTMLLLHVTTLLIFFNSWHVFGLIFGCCRSASSSQFFPSTGGRTSRNLLQQLQVRNAWTAWISMKADKVMQPLVMDPGLPLHIFQDFAQLGTVNWSWDVWGLYVIYTNNIYIYIYTHTYI